MLLSLVSVSGLSLTAFAADSDFTYTVLTDDTIQIDGYTVTSVGEYAFAYCNALQTVVLGDGLTTLSYSVFRDCPAGLSPSKALPSTTARPSPP